MSLMDISHVDFDLMLVLFNTVGSLPHKDV